MKESQREREYKPPTEIVKQFLDDIVRNPRSKRRVAFALTVLAESVKELEGRKDPLAAVGELTDLFNAAQAVVASLPDLDLNDMIKERELDDAAFDRLEEEWEDERDRQACAD